MYDPTDPLEPPLVPPGYALDRRAFKARDRQYDEVMVWLMAGHSDLKVFDPRSVLCDQDVCRAVRDGRPLYFDSDHLSLGGSDLMVEVLIASSLLEN